MAAPNPRRTTRDHPPIGERLRVERQRHNLSLRDLAERLGVSPSLISQVETGRARPSVSTLYAIATELGVSIDELLFLDAERPAPQPLERSGDEPRPGPVQRAADRATIRLASGVVWERLTTASDPDIEFLYVTYEVGGASSPEHEFQRHGGHEWGYVVSGTLSVRIGFDEYEVGPGDAVSIPSTTPHRLFNRGVEPVHAIWFVIGRNTTDGDSGAARTIGIDRGAARPAAAE